MERVNDTALLLGRLLMASLFLPSGINKAMGFGGFAQRLAEQGLPYEQAVAAVGIALEILLPIALIVGIFPRITALLLIVFVIAATGIGHRFWEFAEPARRGQEINFYKNVALIGGLLFYYVSGPGAWSIAGRSVGVRAAQPARA
ncbi:MAG: DoxX family protein [Hyphomicrobiaceae bacterium]|nr:DoxX family protein [Hyphomicrobiaceae bacterium]